MQIKFSLTPETKKLLKKLDKFASKVEMKRLIFSFFNKQGPKAAGHISHNFLSGQRLNRRTGTLARSVTGFAVMHRGVPAMRIGIMRGPALAYAGPLEHGTKPYNPKSPYDTIRPKNAKALAIPKGPALTRAGVDRKGGPRSYPEGFLTFIPFRSSGIAVGGLFQTSSLTREGEQERGESGRFLSSRKKIRVPLRDAIMYYLLVSKVDIRPRWYLRDGFLDYAPRLGAELGAYVRDILVKL